MQQSTGPHIGKLQAADVRQLNRRFKLSTDSSHPFGAYPNLLKDASVGGPDRAWFSDFTYVRPPTSFCYLASIIDEYSRYCVGWALSR
jgi:transposase InsO family protein